MNQRLTLFLFLLIVITACEKPTSEEFTSLDLTIQEIGTNTFELEWTIANVSTFSKYYIVRSKENIPAEFDSIAFDHSTFIEIEKYSEHSFQDFTAEASEQVFYRVFVELNGRKIASNQVTVDNQIDYINFATDDVEYSKMANALYFLAHPSRKIYKWDITTRTLHNTNSANYSDTRTIKVETIHDQEYLIAPENGHEEFFCFDLDLNFVKVVSFSGNKCDDVAISNNGIIVGCMYHHYPIATYDFDNDVLLHTANHSTISSFRKIESIPDRNANAFIELEFNHTLHSYQVGNNGIIQNHDSIIFDIPSFFREIVISPDLQYIAGHSKGIIYNRDLTKFGKLEDDATYQDFAFSSDGKQLIAIRGTWEQEIVIFDFPSFEIQRVIPIGYRARYIFVDDNQLILIAYNPSDNLKHMVQTFHL